MLAGRTFDVLMTRYPMLELQKRLDQGLKDFPESTTIADFRAEKDISISEEYALKASKKIITPHSGIAALFPEKAVQLNWYSNNLRIIVKQQQSQVRLLFPFATIASKGAYQLRDIAKTLGAEVIVAGPLLEDSEFWKGVRVTSIKRNHLSIAKIASKVSAVVIPAYVVNRPQLVLFAAQLGLKVIASEACGLKGIDGVIEISGNNPDDYIEALTQSLTYEKIS